MTTRTAQDVLAAAKSLTNTLAAARASWDRIDAEAADYPAWAAEIFGSPEAQIRACAEDIANARGRLGACRDDLTAMGLSQADCRKLWLGMSAA